jgi:hypothetical protein
VLVLEDGGFPSDGALLSSSPGEKKFDARYNIEWIYDQVLTAGHIQQRYMFVGRDPYQTVGAGSPETFKDRVQIVNDFLTYIDIEYARIAKKESGIWAQVHYEWFTELRNCTALVSGIINFAGWDACDVEHACQVLQASVPANDSPDTLHMENAEYAAQNAHEVSIPLLDISGTAPSNFTKATVSRVSQTFSAPTPPSSISSPSGAGSLSAAGTADPVSAVDVPGKALPARWVHAVKPGKLPPHQGVTVDRWRTFNTPVRNNVTFLYVVGVEGVGHHGVTPAVASIAKTCNYHVVYENSILRRYQAKLLSKTYASTIMSHRHALNPGTNKVLIVEDSSFPAGMDARNSTPQQKKSLGKYNLEWIYDQAVVAKASPRFLYLTRDFYRAVASHPEFDHGFEAHAQVLYDYAQYIHSEYEAISAKQPGLWAQVHYEWFTELRNCTALVSAIIDFAGWDGCDVEYACHVLRQTLRNSTARAVNATDYAYAQTFNLTSPVPVLDISENRTYSFRTAISARVPFTIVQNITSRVRVIRANSTVLAVRTTRLPAAATAGTAGAMVASSSSPVPVAMVQPQVVPVVGGRGMNNKVTLVYVVGVLGAGHDLLVRTIVATARACGHHVIHDHHSLRRAHANRLARSYISALHSFQRAIYRTTNRVLVLDGSPFYADGERPAGTLEEKRMIGKFDLAWVNDRAQDAGVEVKFLYLNRTTSEVLRASNGDAALFAQHAQSVYDFTQFIQEQHQRVEAVQPGLWAQVSYYKLATPSERCDEHVRALLAFIDMGDCDIAPCSQLITNWNTSEYLRPLTAEEQGICDAYAGKLDLPIKML